MLFRENGTSACDAVMMECHGYEITHIDALAHVAMDGTTYNGRPFEEVDHPGRAHVRVRAARSPTGSRREGVLLDVPRSQDRDWIDRGEEVTAADLERAEAWAGVTVGRGDALVVRTGLDAREAVTGPMPHDVRTGLGIDCIEWLYRREVAALRRRLLRQAAVRRRRATAIRCTPSASPGWASCSSTTSRSRSSRTRLRRGAPLGVLLRGRAAPDPEGDRLAGQPALHLLSMTRFGAQAPILAGRVVLVTGGARGIGAAVAVEAAPGRRAVARRLPHLA